MDSSELSATPSEGVAGTEVTLSAPATALGGARTFNHWEVVEGAGSIEGNILTLGSTDVTVEAVYVETPLPEISFRVSGISETDQDKVTYASSIDYPTSLVTVQWSTPYVLDSIVVYRASGGQELELVYISDHQASANFDTAGGNATVIINVRRLYETHIIGTARGSATASPKYADTGDIVTLTPLPNTGYRLTGWVVTDGDITIDENTNQFVMGSSSVWVQPVFESQE